jgi:hypothetical protein
MSVTNTNKIIMDIIKMFFILLFISKVVSNIIGTFFNFYKNIDLVYFFN